MKTLRLLRIVHLAVLAEALIFFGVVLYLKKDAPFVWISEDEPALFTTGILAAIAAVMCAFIVPRIMLKRVRLQESKEKQMQSYLNVSILRMAFFDVGLTLCIVFFLLCGCWIFVLVMVLIALIFIGYFPTQAQIKREIEFDSQDFSEDEFNAT